MATHDGTSSISSAPARPTPLWASLTFTFLNSLGTGIVVAGIYFIARDAYGFGDRRNFQLALLFGLTYIPSALLVGPAIRSACSRLAWLNSRTVLAMIMVALAACCLLPAIVFERRPDGSVAGSWAVWVLLAASGPLNGAMWPVIEGYLSGGRSGPALRAATGRFNVAWSIALVAAFWVMAPFRGVPNPTLLLAALGLIHLGAIALLRWFAPEPAAHLKTTLTQDGCPGCQASVPTPPPHECAHCSWVFDARIVRTHLRVFQWLLPASFLVVASIEPYLPTLMHSMALSVAWETPLASAWMISRVLTFVVMERWHGWHLRRLTPVLAGVTMLVGFVGAVLAPMLLDGIGALVVLVSALSLLGVGIGTIYAAALYYAMESGASEVDAGGAHEALIGLGYSGGPVCGLLALLVAGNAGALLDALIGLGYSGGLVGGLAFLVAGNAGAVLGFESMFIGLVGVVTVLACSIPIWRAFRSGRSAP